MKTVGGKVLRGNLNVNNLGAGFVRRARGSWAAVLGLGVAQYAQREVKCEKIGTG